MNHTRYNYCVESAINVHCDNQRAIKLSSNCVYHYKSKHIDIKYHISKETQEKGIINVKYLATDSMPADIITKSL